MVTQDELGAQYNYVLIIFNCSVDEFEIVQWTGGLVSGGRGFQKYVS